ncbi:Leucine zipper homeobox-associated protein [Dioscorea alata]|uniref:Homeobox-leucine zipper protein HAT14-like n=2 Tax=Dioscorea TaxID=4672 RepID=A0AB40CU63_DIOCR|nr:homeobox-leucine zipper protein HAT14-like [Dioscorea cayenensis subsp. rotundata]KAH7659037.1 Leucine zipper homeobox-associated protein [Dioscorea alata]
MELSSYFAINGCKKDGANHPSLQLELKLPCSFDLDGSHGMKDLDNESAGPSSSQSRWRFGEDDDADRKRTRKKLRLSKEQACYLEESFKEHATLNPKQKLAIAKRLGLRPRQVEVWFQNRRARTKLKQTEVDCEYLRQYCEFLTEENQRLQKEIQDLRSLKSPQQQPLQMRAQAATLTLCPSCEHAASIEKDGFVSQVKFRDNYTRLTC